MAVQRIALNPGFDVSRVATQSVSTLIGCYSEQQDGKGQFPIVGFPGPKLFAKVDAPVRGIFPAPDGSLYVVGGGTLYKVDTAGVTTALGGISGTGIVEMDANRTQIIVCAAPRVHVYNLGTGQMSEAQSAEWPGAASMAVVSSFAVYVSPNSDRFFISNLDDATTIQTLNFALNVANPDATRAVRVVQGELWFLGIKTIEIWPLTGAANFPFERRGINQDIGIVARDTARNYGNGLVWLGRERTAGGLSVYQAVESYSPQRISTHAVERLLERAVYPDRAFAFVQRVEGHHWYVLTCDAGTLAYDAATQAWQQLGAGVWPFAGSPPPSAVQAAGYDAGGAIVGDNVGRLSRLSYDVHAELDGAAVREIVTGPMGSVGRQVQIMAIGLEIEGGLGSLTVDPEIIMSLSRDGGHTYDSAKPQKAGLVGRYQQTVRWNRLGRARDFVARFRMTDAAPFHVTGAWADVMELDVG